MVRVAGKLMVGVAVLLGLANGLMAQAPPVHYHHADNMPPGAIGRQQLDRGGPLPGYFQPVEIRAPQGALISTAGVGEFDEAEPAPLTAGLLIGSVYRLRLTSIPNLEGIEVFPTIEVIDRLYPPIGMEFRFPIVIDLTHEELEMAGDGKFVTRVVYVEDPDNSLPIAQQPGEQAVFEAATGENPLEIADGLGRPVAIVRLGGRLPDMGGPDQAFLYGSPPLLKWKPRGTQSPAAILELPRVTARAAHIIRPSGNSQPRTRLINGNSR